MPVPACLFLVMDKGLELLVWPWSTNLVSHALLEKLVHQCPPEEPRYLCDVSSPGDSEDWKPSFHLSATIPSQKHTLSLAVVLQTGRLYISDEYRARVDRMRIALNVSPQTHKGIVVLLEPNDSEDTVMDVSKHK